MKRAHRQRLLLNIIWFTLICCSPKRDNNREISDENREHPKTDNIAAILYKNEILHEFSSPAAMDTFKISATGQSIEAGEIVFQIVNGLGQVILSEKFQFNFLIDYGFGEFQGTREEYIKNRIDTFLEEENFHQPAIGFEEIFDEDYSDMEIWEDIKSDQTSIGFTYLIGKEDGRHIAYSKKLGKVVLYFNCC